jgi:hypothetical protein
MVVLTHDTAQQAGAFAGGSPHAMIPGGAGPRGAEQPTLIFVAGIMARSGTNFIGRMLLSHPDVCRPQGHWELPLLDVADKFSDLHSAFIRRRGRNRLDYSLDDFARSFGAGLMGLLTERVAPGERADYLLHKNPGTAGIEHFHRFFPGAKLIFLIRDGRDNVNSLVVAAGCGKKRLSLKRIYVLYKFSRMWAASARRVRSYSAASNCPVVKYEDLNRSPEEGLRRIAEYVGLEATQGWIEQAGSIPVSGSGFYRSAGETVAEDAGATNWRKLPKTASFKPVGRWRDSWTWLEKLIFQRVAGRELKALGYD